jgi:hypothetical protein
VTAQKRELPSKNSENVNASQVIFYERVDVQWGQRVALIAMTLQQLGHSFVTTGPAGTGCSRFIELMAFTTKKIQNATITKFNRTVRKFP